MRSILHQTARRTTTLSSRSLLPLTPRTLHTTTTALLPDSDSSSSSLPPPSLYKSTGPPPPLRGSRSRSPTGGPPPPPLSSLRDRSTPAPTPTAPPPPPPPPPTASSSSTSSPTRTTPSELLTLSRRHLRLTAPPSYTDLLALQTLYKQLFPTPTLSLSSNALRAEILLLTLARANRSPDPPIKAERQPLSVTLAFFVASLKKCGPPSFDLETIGINAKKDLVPLVWKLAQRRRIREFVEIVHQWNRVDFDEEEVGLIREALEFWKEDRSEGKRVAKGRWAYLDWEEGTRKRLGEEMERFARAARRREGEGEGEGGEEEGLKASVAGIQVWVKEQQRQQEERGDVFVPLKRLQEISNEAFVRLSNLTPRLLDAPSSSSPETLQLLFDLYQLYHPPPLSYSSLQPPPPLPWRQQASALLPLLLLFGHHPSSSPSPSITISFTQHLLPLLPHLLLLPPSFLPSTPSYPSLLPSLLPLATTIDQTLLLVQALLHAQQDPPKEYLPSLWRAFLGSLALQREVPAVGKVLGSELFGTVEEFWEEEGEEGEGEKAMEEVVQVYLWRCRNVREDVRSVVPEEGGETGTADVRRGKGEKKEKEIRALWELEGVLIEREQERRGKKEEDGEEDGEDGEEEEEEGGMMKALRGEVRRVLEENL